MSAIFSPCTHFVDVCVCGRAYEKKRIKWGCFHSNWTQLKPFIEVFIMSFRYCTFCANRTVHTCPCFILVIFPFSSTKMRSMFYIQHSEPVYLYTFSKTMELSTQKLPICCRFFFVRLLLAFTLFEICTSRSWFEQIRWQKIIIEQWTQSEFQYTYI